MARSKATTSSQVRSFKGEREHRPSWRGGGSYSLGEGAEEPQDSYLVLCKIFIHSPKRLRLQVLGSVGREGISSRATFKVLHPALA